MNLVQLLHPEEIHISVDMDALEAIIAHRLSLTTAALFSTDIDSLELTMKLPVTIDGFDRSCRDIDLYINEHLQLEVLVGRVVMYVHESQSSYQLVFGLHKQPDGEHDGWQVSPLVVKISGETTEESDEALEEYLQTRLSERLALLGL